MSGPKEHASMAGSFSNEELISRLKGEETSVKITSKRSLPKSTSERFRNGKDAQIPAGSSSQSGLSAKIDLSTSNSSWLGLPPRSLIKTAHEKDLQKQSGDSFRSKSPTDVFPAFCFEEPEKPSPSIQEDGRESALEAELKSIMVGVCATADMLEQSEKECKNLRDQNRELQKDLVDAQDFIFSLQRREQKITESEAAAEFNSLCMIVEEWVQTKLGDALEKKLAKGRTAFPTMTARRFLSLIPTPGKEAFRYPETDEYNIIAAIMRFLCIEIFDREFYCPIDSGALDFLASIERSMRNQEPRQDLVTWRSWRSETFTAVTKRHEFARQRQSHSDKISAELAAMLQLFLPRSDNQKLRLSVQNALIEPALQLAHKMHLSVNDFHVEFTSWHRKPLEDRRGLPRDSSAFECITVSPPGKVLKFPVLEGIVTYLFDVSPELVFRSVKTDSYGEPRVLKRARVLVLVTKEEEGPYMAPPSQPKESPTLLGWMDESVHPRQVVHVTRYNLPGLPSFR